MSVERVKRGFSCIYDWIAIFRRLRLEMLVIERRSTEYNLLFTFLQILIRCLVILFIKIGVENIYSWFLLWQMLIDFFIVYVYIKFRLLWIIHEAIYSGLHEQLLGWGSPTAHHRGQYQVLISLLSRIVWIELPFSH